MHFSQGPIDLIIKAEGEASVVDAAHEQAWQRFATILTELVQELPLLQQAVGTTCTLRGKVSQRMWQACAPYSDVYITPMAAVAGAVAQEIIAAYHRPGITRAWVNNGGDIAVHLTPGATVKVGVLSDPGGWPQTRHGQATSLDGQLTITSTMPVRGIATSGWRGRSFSLGIADSVTVLAATAAQADAAATLIANAVNVDDARIVRKPACELKDNTDLGDLRVTVNVPVLDATTVQAALDAGYQRAQSLQRAGLIWAAALACQSQWRSTCTDTPQMLSSMDANDSMLALKLRTSTPSPQIMHAEMTAT